MLNIELTIIREQSLIAWLAHEQIENNLRNRRFAFLFLDTLPIGWQIIFKHYRI